MTPVDPALPRKLPALPVRQVAAIALLLLALTLVGVLGLRFTTGAGWFDCLYMAVITLTTVGYAETVPLDTAGRIFIIAYLGASLGVLMHPRGIYRKSANYVVTAADNGLLFLATAAVSFTLPTKENGLAFRFLQTADFDLTIVGNADIVHQGNAAASSVGFTTATQKIGSQALVECMYTADGVLKWVVSNLGGTTATVV